MSQRTYVTGRRGICYPRRQAPLKPRYTTTRLRGVTSQDINDHTYVSKLKSPVGHVSLVGGTRYKILTVDI